MIPGWNPQIGIVRWITAAAACFGTVTQLTVVFLIANFLGQIVFGIHAMMMESRRRQRLVAHA